ncbi:MAG: radical SAM protein, partial [Deltaproteobacteria bacterium]|nr:radical SAM protein [Deltaproteobacteria bacterium]
VVLVTSTMTYWYPGVLQSIRLVKKHFSDVPVALGGIYATLCHEHAVNSSGANHVIPGPGETRILQLLEQLTGHSSEKPTHTVEVNTLPWPAIDLLPDPQYVCTLTSRGCPFHCPYCASDLLCPKFVRRDPIEVVDELEYWHQKYSIVNVAFYDDALLLDPGKHILVLLKEVRRRGLPLQFHTPNGVHVSGLTEEVCESLFLSGFKTVRLGLETTDNQRQHQLGDKVKPGAFSTAMANLTRAGFQADQIGVYLLCGLPGQEPTEVAESIRMVRAHGARPYLAEYSPIPGTSLWSEALDCSPFDLANEPLYHNNSILPCRSKHFGLEELQQLKQLCKA